jgi:hypothetical protein
MRSKGAFEMRNAPTHESFNPPGSGGRLDNPAQSSAHTLERTLARETALATTLRPSLFFTPTDA